MSLSLKIRANLQNFEIKFANKKNVVISAPLLGAP
jgi:hypothetical protein